jgi:hypothetical protein
LTTKYSPWLELKCRDEAGGSIFASLDDVLRSPELQSRLTPSAKRKFKTAKDKLRAAGRLYEIPHIEPTAKG